MKVPIPAIAALISGAAPRRGAAGSRRGGVIAAQLLGPATGAVVELGLDELAGLGRDAARRLRLPLDIERVVDREQDFTDATGAADDHDGPEVGTPGDHPLADPGDLDGTAGVDAELARAVLPGNLADAAVDV